MRKRWVVAEATSGCDARASAMVLVRPSGHVCAELADALKAQFGVRYRERYGEWPMLPNLICAAGTDSPSLNFDGWYIKACQTVDGVEIEAGDDPKRRHGKRRALPPSPAGCLHEFCRMLVAERDTAAHASEAR